MPHAPRGLHTPGPLLPHSPLCGPYFETRRLWCLPPVHGPGRRVCRTASVQQEASLVGWGEGLPSDLKEGGTGIGWRDRHCGSPGSRAERGAARRARRPWGSPQRPLHPPARWLPVLCPFPAGVTASARPRSILESLLALAGPASLGSDVRVGPRPLGSVPWEEPQGELHREGLRGAPGEPRAVRWSRLPFRGGSQVVRGGPSAQSTPDGPRGHVQTLGSGGPDSGPVRRPHSASPVGRRVFGGALPPSVPSPAPCGSGLRLREAPWCFCVNGDPAGSSSFQIPSKWTASASLSEPNDESGANVDASKMWRDDREQFYKIARQTVQKSLGL